MNHKKFKTEHSNPKFDPMEIETDKKEQINYLEYLPSDIHQIDGITSVITIKTGENTTEIIINNNESQVTTNEPLNQPIIKYNTIKPIQKKTKKTKKTNHKFPKLVVSDRSKIKKYVIHISKNLKKI